MVIGGEIENTLIRESFSRVKSDIQELTSQLLELREEHNRLKQENIVLKQKLSQNAPGAVLDTDIVSHIVKETLKTMQPKNQGFQESIIKKINKKRRSILKNRIRELASTKRFSVSDIKDIIVDQESLCSKATFYRYISAMKKKGLIDMFQAEDLEVVINL